MFSTSIIIHENALQFGNIEAVMYGQLLEGYTPVYGPSAGTPLGVDQWVYLIVTSQNQFDYAVCPAPNTTVPSFATYTAKGTNSVQLPSVQIQASHFVFLFGPGSGVQTDVTGLPQQPNPATDTGVYDFVEFTYNTSNILYINTSMIDQFGMPTRIQMNPANASLPNGAGVIMDRDFVFKNYKEFINANSTRSAYMQCMQDAFGNALTTRIVSPKTAVLSNGVSGLVLSLINQGTNLPSSTLPAGTYYYVVTALNSAGNETYAQYEVSSIAVPTNIAVNIGWAPNSFQPAGTVSYNVYRGTLTNNVVSWALLLNTAASNFTSGCAVMDNGQAVVSNTAPSFNPLNTSFDSEIETFFNNYLPKANGGKGKTLTLTATDGTSDGYIYTFSGTTVLASDKVNMSNLNLKLNSVTDASGNTVSSPPVAVNTVVNIWYPFWNTNTYNPSLPSPPSWANYTTTPASVMVLAAEGVFADNAIQPVPSGANAADYSVIIGNLENQIVSAITRGIANLPGNPQNWGNGTAPIQTAPQIVSGTSKLKLGTVYFYVLTATNANGESYGSLEFSMMTNAANQCIQLNWMAMPPSATAINVYRGERSYDECQLIAIVENPATSPATSYVDNGTVIKTAAPPTYFPSDVPSSAYDEFFHLTNVSLNGAAYAGPYDDQGGWSSTLSGTPATVNIILGNDISTL